MNFSKVNHPVTVILSFILLFPSCSIHATEYHAFRVTGSDCTLCHTNPQTGSLNQTGTLFQEEGYRYPLTWKGILLYCLWGLPLFLSSLAFIIDTGSGVLEKMGANGIIEKREVRASS